MERVTQASRPAVGSMVRIDNMAGDFEVTANHDPGLIEVRSPYGTTFRVGEQAVTGVRHERQHAG